MKTIPTITTDDLATLAGLTPRRVRQLSDEGKLPPITGNTLPMLDAIKALFQWFARDGELLAAEKLKIATETARRLKMQNDIRAGHVLDAHDAERQAAEAESYYFGELDRMLRELPPALVGLDALQAQEVLQKFITDLRQRSREMFAAVAQPQKA